MRPCRFLDGVGTAVHRYGAAEEGPGLNGFVRHRKGYGLTQLDVIEWRLRGIERDVPQRIRNRHPRDLELSFLDELVKVLRRKPRGEIGVTALEHGAPRTG